MIAVLSIAFPFAPVGPNLVGGAEQILSDLDEALVARGDRSLVVACEGSRPAGRLFAIPQSGRAMLDEVDGDWCREQFHAAVDRALASQMVDLIHVHCMDLHEYDFPADVPLLITLHLPISWYPRATLEDYARRSHFCYVSESQRRAGLPLLGDGPVIENGVDVDPLAGTNAKTDFALVMGRICPEKNAHAALEAGTRARVRVVLGGQVYPYRSHQQYFEEKVKPLIVGSRPPAEHMFAGPLTPEARRRLLAVAKCLLHPTLAPETSSLVAMEALAAGTPVIAYRSGALTEIVEDGVTGFLVNGVEEMADAMGRVHTISPERCRAIAARRFSKQRMIEQYFELYRAIFSEGSERHESNCGMQTYSFI
jgi:glycosyltransferase involved in cell wall biosynthesis